MQLAELVDEFRRQREAAGGLYLGRDETEQCAVDAARFYAGWRDLEDERSQGGLHRITADTKVSASEWAIIRPLFLLYVERESALVIEASRVAGVEAVGRASSEVAADIVQAEAALPQLAYCEDSFSVGFPEGA